MLYLYYKPTCPFCQRVLTANEAIGAPLELLDVSADEVLREELITKGGKRQIPFLVDEERGVMLYESADIIAYLEEHYQTGNALGVVPATMDRDEEGTGDGEDGGGEGE